MLPPPGVTARSGGPFVCPMLESPGMSTAEAPPPGYAARRPPLAWEDHEIDLRGPLTALARQLPLIAAIVGLALLVAALYVYSRPRAYEGIARVILARPRVSISLVPQFVTRDDFDVRQFYTYARHPEVEQAVLTRFGDALPEADRRPGALLTRLKVTGDKDDVALMGLQITDPDAARAGQLADAWADAYVEFVQRTLNPAVQARRLVDAQLAEARGELERREDAVRLHQQQRGLGLPLRDDSVRLELSAAAPIAPSGRLGSRGRDLVARATTLNEQRSTREQVRIAQGQVRALQASGGELRLIAGELTPLGISAGEGADQALKALDAKDRALTEAIDRSSTEVRALESALAGDVAELERLERERDIARDGYLALAKKAEETKVQLATDWPAARVFQRAGEETQPAPRPWLPVLGATGAVATVVALATALWVDRRRRLDLVLARRGL
jgi:uncharacterized protein involved in exopolysaccharide biosynthesis